MTREMADIDGDRWGHQARGGADDVGRGALAPLTQAVVVRQRSGILDSMCMITIRLRAKIGQDRG